MVSFRPQPEDKASGAHYIGGWVGPRIGLDTVEKRKIFLSCFYRESNHDTSIVP
jgi:hypothetical protein